MASFSGRDPYQSQRLAFFVQRIGHLIACEIDADDVDDCLDALKSRGKLMNKGGTKIGGQIVPTHKPLADSTINRYRCTLQATLTWARKKRLMPKGWSNHVNETQRLAEDNARTRYLKPDEYERLLKMSRISQWNKLAALVMMAVTTGARKGALLGLKWADVDLNRGEAFYSALRMASPLCLFWCLMWLPS